MKKIILKVKELSFYILGIIFYPYLWFVGYIESKLIKRKFITIAAIWVTLPTPITGVLVVFVSLKLLDDPNGLFVAPYLKFLTGILFFVYWYYEIINKKLDYKINAIENT